MLWWITFINDTIGLLLVLEQFSIFLYVPFSPYRESNTPVEERRIVFVGKLEKDITKSGLRAQFSKFGPVIEVRLHSKEDGWVS